METNTQEKAISIVKDEKSQAITIQKGTSLFFDVVKFEHAQRVAKVFAESSMVPQQFQKNLPNCVIALNLSERMQVDPFMLMQNMYIVHGRPGIEAKLAIALINQSGRFSEVEYEMMGDKEKDDFSCKAYATKLSTGKVLYGPKVDIAMAKAEGWYNKQGSKWKTMPELMLQYRAAMFFGRTYCPDLLLGMLTREELQDIIDVTPISLKQELVGFEESKVNKKTYQPIETVESEPAESLPTKYENDLLITSFAKLNKEPLQKFEETHREEIQNWPQDAKDAFNEKWETKTKVSYETFLRRLQLINGEKESGHQGFKMVVCPITQESKTEAGCENECPNPELFQNKECIERFGN